MGDIVVAMSKTDAIDAAIGPLHGGRLGWRWSAARARVSVSRLDVALASGADPWSSRHLMLRAARLSSLGERRRIAAGLTDLIGRARCATLSDTVRIRRRLVLEHVNEILMLADRLRALEPVDVAIVAQLALLVCDGASPVYVGGRPSSELTDVIARARQAMDVV
jgi:hypothetical protein